MHLKKLDTSFYDENTHLVEALDNFNGNWQEGKARGYGVVIINLNNLTFAIPLRSNIRHKAAYITSSGTVKKGLDFSKAVLISKDSYVSNAPFKIPSEEHKKLLDKEHFVTHKFEKYVDHYIKAVKSSDQNILRSEEYRYTTLQNYHLELAV
jgi:protein AbiQ